jgi:hypothetical protein
MSSSSVASSKRRVTAVTRGRRLRQLALALGLAGTTTSCQSPLEPAQIVGEYAATRWAGRTVPFFIDGPGDEDYEFVYDSISLLPDGTAWIRSRHGPPSVPSTPSTEEFAHWTLDGHGLTLRRVCDPRPVPCLTYTWVHRYRVRGDRLLAFDNGTVTAEYRAASAAAP